MIKFVLLIADVYEIWSDCLLKGSRHFFDDIGFKKYDNVLKYMKHLSLVVCACTCVWSFFRHVPAVLLVECSCLLKVAIKGIRIQIKDY